jgi:hypothetical protein
MVFENKYTDEELLDILAELAVELGRVPTMIDMQKREGPPYPSIYQRRFSSFAMREGKGRDDGWNRALKLVGLKYNRLKPDNDGECKDCGVDGDSDQGRLIRWGGGDEVVCMGCYAKRYYRRCKRGE